MSEKNINALLSAIVALLLVTGVSGQAAVKTWTGTTDGTWATGANWGGTAPATADSLTFTSATGAGGLTLSDNLMTPGAYSIAGITFNAGAAAFVINPNASGTNGFTLTGNVANNGTNLETINDLIATTAVRTFTMTTGGGNITLGGVVSGTGGGITTAGVGTLTLTGINTYTGGTTVASGTTLSLDYSGAASPLTAANIVANSSALTLGGTLSIKGGGSTAANSQTFNGTTLTASKSSLVTFNLNSATSLSLTLGAITRNTGSTLDIAFANGTGAVTTSSATLASNSVLVSAATNGTAYATANGGSTWATNMAGILGALSTYATGNANYLTANNVDVTNGDSVSGVTVNTLRFNGASIGLTLAGTNVVNTGGILVTSAATGASLTGGTLTGNATSNREVVIIDNGTLNVGSVIANNGGATALTLAGAGTTTLNGANTYTGSTSIDGGTVKLGVAQVGTTSGAFGTGSGALNLASGTTVDLQGNNVTVGAITANSPGTNAIVTSTSAATLTLAGGSNVSTLTVSGAASLLVNGGASLATGTTLITGTGSLGFQNQTGALRDNQLSTNLGANGTLLFNGSGQIQNTNAQTLGSGNALVINGTGNTWNYQNTVTVAGAVSGNGSLALSNGFNPTFTLSGDLSGFHGSMVLNGLGNGQAIQFTNATTFSNDAKWALNQAFTSSTAGQNSYFIYNGTGNKTIILGELSGTNVGAGSTALTDNSAGTTATWQIGGANTSATYAGIIQNGTGTSALTKVGTGTLTLSGVSTYTGATAVNAGTLALTSTGALNATSGVTVASGATLAGSGTIGTGTSSPLTMTSGSIISPGIGGIGTLTNNGNMTLQGTTTFNFDLSAGGSGDFINLGSSSLVKDLSFTGTTFNFTDLGGSTGTYNLIGFSSTTFTAGDLANFTATGLSGTFGLTGADLTFTVAAVPEPSTCAMFMSGALMLGLVLRRRQQA